MDSTHKKLNELKVKARVYNYKTDKNGWVKYFSGKPKQKLRKYITVLAQKLTAHNKLGFRDNRQKLITYYNKDGLDGIRRVMFLEFFKTEKDES